MEFEMRPKEVSGFEIKAEKGAKGYKADGDHGGCSKLCFLKMPPHPTPIFMAPNASIVPEAVPSELDAESEGDVMEIQ